MIIERIETCTRDPLCFVKVYASGGARGIGQTAPYNADITAAVLHRQVAPHFLGRPVEELERTVDLCIDRNHKYPWSYVCRALGGVETAVWDLRGKVARMSVCELLGGSPGPVPAYGSSMSRTITPEEEARRFTELRERHGFDAFKFRIGAQCGHDEDAWPGRTEAMVSVVRRQLPGRVRLLVDANSCYTPPGAIEVGRMLQDHGVCHFEEPCPYWELEWTAEVTAALTMDVAGGEQDVDLAQWRRMIAMRAVDIVQPDVCYVGGMIRAGRVAAMAHEQGMVCTPHAANRSMVTLFAMHLLRSIPNPGPYLEFSIEEQPWTAGLFEPALVVEDGEAAMPAGPGWGVEINPDWLKAAEIRVSDMADR